MTNAQREYPLLSFFGLHIAFHSKRYPIFNQKSGTQIDLKRGGDIMEKVKWIAIQLFIVAATLMPVVLAIADDGGY